MQAIRPRQASPAISNPVSAAATRTNAEFDRYARRFASEVFVNEQRGSFFISKAMFSEAKGNSNDFLKNNYFAGRIADGQAYQLLATGLRTQTFNGKHEFYATFEGGLEVSGKQQQVSIKNADGTQAELKLVTGRDSEALLSRVTFIELPQVYQPQHMAKLPDGRFVYVDGPRNGWSYNDFRAFVGKPQAMLQVPIVCTSRLRDGGTTTVDTKDAKLHFPFRGVPTYKPNGEDEVKMEHVDIKKFSAGNAYTAFIQLGIDIGMDGRKPFNL